MGQVVSKNPYDYGENVWAALKAHNPMVEAFLSSREQGRSGVVGVAGRLTGALGIKTGGFPTQQERLNKETEKQFKEKKVSSAKFTELSLSERLRVERAIKTAFVPNMNEITRNAAGERMFWHEIGSTQKLEASLPPEQQEFLKKNLLPLPGFKAEKVFDGVRMPTTQDEKLQADALFSKWYTKMIERMMKLPKFEARPQTQKEIILHQLLDDARTAARAEWVRSLAKKGSRSALATPLPSPLETSGNGPQETNIFSPRHSR